MSTRTSRFNPGIRQKFGESPANLDAPRRSGLSWPPARASFSRTRANCASFWSINRWLSVDSLLCKRPRRNHVRSCFTPWATARKSPERSSALERFLVQSLIPARPRRITPHEFKIRAAAEDAFKSARDETIRGGGAKIFENHVPGPADEKRAMRDADPCA